MKRALINNQHVAAASAAAAVTVLLLQSYYIQLCSIFSFFFLFTLLLLFCFIHIGSCELLNLFTHVEFDVHVSIFWRCFVSHFGVANDFWLKWLSWMCAWMHKRIFVRGRDSIVCLHTIPFNRSAYEMHKHRRTLHMCTYQTPALLIHMHHSKQIF